ncbi:MAG: helix-turn-helix domain-containing protein [Flavobacteriaceae bacterium]|nr:helix-turn-helix domain-containing protein [Flavobacteriaceae bacterium]
MKKLGELIKEKRIAKGFTLRAFCMRIEADPSNWSKVERGLIKFPTASLLDEITKVLDLDNQEVQEIKELAVIQIISKDLDLNEKLLEALPVFFRTTRDLKPSEEQLKELIQILKNN